MCILEKSLFSWSQEAEEFIEFLSVLEAGQSTRDFVLTDIVSEVGLQKRTPGRTILLESQALECHNLPLCDTTLHHSVMHCGTKLAGMSGGLALVAYASTWDCGRQATEKIEVSMLIESINPL